MRKGMPLRETQQDQLVGSAFGVDKSERSIGCKGVFRVRSLLLFVASGSMLGAWTATHSGATVGNYLRALMTQQTEAFWLNLFAGNAGFAMAVAAIIGGMAGAAIYGLAVTSPAHHGRIRPDADWGAGPPDTVGRRACSVATDLGDPAQ